MSRQIIQRAVLTWLLIVFVTLVPKALAEDAAESWSEKMQEASKVLVDAFPFIYSAKEFRSPQNAKRISSYIERLKANSHSLPASEGKAFIGLDPLIDQFNTRITRVLGRADRTFKEKKYKIARSQVKMAIHKCFACHTAYQMGPQDNKMNVEVKGFLLVPMGKVEVLVALRQFHGALKILEQQLTKGLKSGQSSQKLMPYLRMHLLISVRALQDMERGQKAIKTFQTALTKAKLPEDLTAASWAKDLTWWAAQKGSAAEKLTQLSTYSQGQGLAATPDQHYVQTLLRTYLLHQSLVDRKKPKALAQAYWQLGQAYRDLRISILADLPNIYFDACSKAAPKSPEAKLCKRAIGS